MGIMTGLLLLLCVGVTVSSAVDLQKRIIGGQDCNKTERLYHVKLIDFKDRLICGGSLVGNKWVLTAAHCWKPYMKALVGAHPGLIQKSFIIEAPPQMYVENNKVHDLMLLQLPETFTRFDPVRLPDCNKKAPQIGTPVQTAGHASTSKGPRGERQRGTSVALQCADIKVADCQRLKDILGFHPDYNQFYQHQRWHCFKSHGVDVCPGDSGGGVIYNGMIYGVNSFSGSRTHACDEPAAFMDICYSGYNKWIRQTITTIQKKKKKFKV